MRLRLISVLALASAAQVATGRAAGAAEQAGVSAAVRGEVALARSQAVGRQLRSGEPIFLDDALTSGPRSGMQILLLDETVFTMGPESELVVDEFVYDPATKQGKVNARVTKGVFRFVTGWIPKTNPKDLEVKLPSGTLGVRGTIVGGSVDPASQSSLLVLLGEGQENDTNSPSGAFEACNAGECRIVNRAGFGLTIGGPGEPPSEPFRVPLEDLRRITGGVSDPGGVVDVAASAGTGDGETHDGMSQKDGRSPSTVAGEGGTGEVVSLTQKRLEGVDSLDGLTDDAQQDARGPRDVGLDRIVADSSQGQGVASFSRKIQTEDGGYDFQLTVDIGRRVGDLAFSNIASREFGIQNGSLQSSAGPRAFNGRDVFSAEGMLGTACEGGCPAVGVASILSRDRLRGPVDQVLGVSRQPKGSAGFNYLSLTPPDAVTVTPAP